MITGMLSPHSGPNDALEGEYFRGEGGVRYRVLRTETRAKIERNSSCFRPPGRRVTTPATKTPPRRARGPRWTSPHTLSSPIVRRWKGILRKKSAQNPPGKERSSWRPLPGRAIVGPARYSALNLRGLDAGVSPVPSPLGTGEGESNHLPPFDQSGQLKPVQPFCGIFIERQRCRTTSPDAEGADQGVFECSDSISERNDGVIDLLLILNLECIRR